MPFLLLRPAFAHAELPSNTPPVGEPFTGSTSQNKNPQDREHPLQVQSNEQPRLQKALLAIAPPEGFEDLDGPIQTFFDVFYEGKRVGAFEGTLYDHQFKFEHPEDLARALQGINRGDVEAALSGQLPSNEDERCLVGETEGCGRLPFGQTGVVVDPDRFKVSVFLGREYLTSVPSRDVLLGSPVSGPSLIQNIAASVSSSSQSSEGVRFGAVLDTYASIEKTSLVSRVNADDSRGIRWQEAYAQHYFSGYRIAGGLIRDDGSANLDSTVFYGAEISSFDRRDRAANDATGTVLDVVLPAASRVEIYRNGTLVSARQYPAGLQVLDTSDLPVGSYPVRIVARDAGGVVVDETRSYSKTPDLPPPGQTNFSVRAGVRAVDGITEAVELDTQSSLFPETTGEAIISASATRRISASSAARLGVTVVKGEFYPEAEVQLYKGELRANAAVAAGPDSQYSAVANVNFQLGKVSGSLSGRTTEAKAPPSGQLYDPKIYRPFFQSENSIFGSLSTPFYNGSISLRASHSESDLSQARNTIGLNYTRPFKSNWFGYGIFGLDAVTSEDETRVGFRVTFRRSVDRKSSVNGAFGADYSSYDLNGVTQDQVDPLFLAGYSRSDRFRGISLDNNFNAGTANGETNFTYNGAATSRRGELDLFAGATRSRDTDETDVYLASNLQTGFVIGGSKLQFGTLGFGDAAILVDIPKPDQSKDAKGSFRVTMASQSEAIVNVGQSASILVPSLTNATVGLIPEDAPPFDIDLTPREVPLYPGNVVRLTWNAYYMVSAIGRLTDAQGNGIANAVIQTASDLAVTTQQGYFSITGRVGEDVQARTQGGKECGSIATLNGKKEDEAYIRLKDVTCVTSPELAESEQPPEPSPDEQGTFSLSSLIGPNSEPLRFDQEIHEIFDQARLNEAPGAFSDPAEAAYAFSASPARSRPPGEDTPLQPTEFAMRLAELRGLLTNQPHAQTDPGDISEDDWDTLCKIRNSCARLRSMAEAVGQSAPKRKQGLADAVAKLERTSDSIRTRLRTVQSAAD